MGSVRAAEAENVRQSVVRGHNGFVGTLKMTYTKQGIHSVARVRPCDKAGQIKWQV